MEQMGRERTGEQKLEVWEHVGERTLDMGGIEVAVAVFARKVLGPVVGRRQYDNGYEKDMTELRQDRQGRTYHKRVEVDYYSPTRWQRDEGGARLYSRPYPVNKRISVDVFGRRLDAFGRVARAKPLDNWCTSA